MLSYFTFLSLAFITSYRVPLIVVLVILAFFAEYRPTSPYNLQFLIVSLLAATVDRLLGL